MAKASLPRTMVVFADDTGHEPFTDWLYGLKDSVVRRRILIRLARLREGNYGDCKFVGEGVFELRFFFGSGYRVYFGEREGRLVILLCGGDKSTQTKDIRIARYYWKEYLTYEKV